MMKKHWILGLPLLMLLAMLAAPQWIITQQLTGQEDGDGASTATNSQGLAGQFQSTRLLGEQQISNAGQTFNKTATQEGPPVVASKQSANPYKPLYTNGMMHDTTASMTLSLPEEGVRSTSVEGATVVIKHDYGASSNASSREESFANLSSGTSAGGGGGSVAMATSNANGFDNLLECTLGEGGCKNNNATYTGHGGIAPTRTK